MLRRRSGPYLLVLAVALLSAPPSAAHRLAPALLAIEEAVDGALEVTLKTPLPRTSPVELAAALPERCAAADLPDREVEASSVTLRWRADCGAEGLVGERVGVEGLSESGANALLRIALRDGRRFQAVLHGDAPAFEVPARASAARVFADYLRLGALHIAGGFDHLLFVFGLLLLATGARALVATVTAFTAGHSVTLSLAALGVVHFPSAPIELLIAATILLLALELARGPDAPASALRRWPWAVAFGFGLLHGLGFAGALAEIGLPQQEIPLALFSFNVGIELGQLAFVALVLAARAAAEPALRRAPPPLLRAPVTAMGALAFYWCLDRAAGLS